MADEATIKKTEEVFKSLKKAPCYQSQLKKYLTVEVVAKLKGRKTKLGGTLLDVIQSAERFHDADGVLPPDADAYATFKDLFDPIIHKYYGGIKPTDRHPATDWGETRVTDLKDLDPEMKFIQSTRIRCARSFAGYPFNPCLTEEGYKEVEEKAKKIFENILDPELQGTYYPLTGMTEEVKKQLIADHYLFKKDGGLLEAANACHFWPTGRGIFLNHAKTFLVWVNEEDHLRIISMQPGGDIGKVLDRLIRGVNIIEKQAQFSRDERLGWLTFCPTNLGTTVRASVHVKIPKVSDKPHFKELCEQMKLDLRGTHGEHTDASWSGTYDVSNKARLGLTEFEAVKAMYDGVKKLIEMEKSG